MVDKEDYILYTNFKLLCIMNKFKSLHNILLIQV
jgi:hypothetical protein